MELASIDPTSGVVLERFAEDDDAALERKLDAATRAFRERRTGDLAARCASLDRAATLLDVEGERLARIAVAEVGKPIRQARAELEKCARTCRHYAQHAPRYLADEPLEADATESYVRALPLGPIFAIMPWNFPFWQVVRFAAPALAAGNVALLKHAGNVTRCALALEELLVRAGFGDGGFQALLLEVPRVRGVILDPRIAAVTLTGSERAGSAVGAAAGEALKKTVLELGGSDPFIVMPSADLDAAARIGVTARFLNGGQSCIAAKRFIVHADVYDAFAERLVAVAGALAVGDPLRDETDVGPLATRSIRDGVDRQVRASVERGARVLLGGRPVDRDGWWYPPTVLADVPPDAPAAAEEVFGPVAALFRARDLDDAIRIANATPYGLGSSVWTDDRAEERRFVAELEAGQTFVNAMVASDPRLPFGGIKRSGYGRELAASGLREFVNLKTVFVDRAGRHHAALAE